ncbi:MAG: hypothetical protein DRJ42_20580 [Deltaproteobacteria bacterium]|nr:MAG: hypothetical protein DRJ42_20580 [Deltaproteobacteria bacterium]
MRPPVRALLLALPFALLLVPGVLLSAACGDDGEPSSVTPARPTDPEPDPDPELDATPIATPLDGLPEGRVRGLLDAWLAAQNAGDFDAYSALYGDRFEGVKRSGERTYHYAREPWLDDRRRMFARPMQVSAEDVRIARVAKGAVISFEQHWSAATYQDVGPKNLIVVEERGELRIGREEMRASQILGRGEAGAPALAEFLLVVDVGGPHVLLGVDVDEASGRGPLTLVQKQGLAAATRAVHVPALDEPVRAMLGAEVELFGTGGAVCRVTVGEAKIVHRVNPHFSTVQTWNGLFDESPRDDEQIAIDVWELGAAGAFLAAEISGDDCAGALWGRLAGAEEPPAVFAPYPADPGQTRAALSAFRGLPGYALVTTDFRGYGRAYRGPWDAHGGARAAVYRWREATTGRTLMTVRARAGAGCADFSAAQWGLFEEVDGSLSPRTDETAPGDYEARSIIDLDGDGLVEVIIADGLLRPSADGGYRQVIDVTPPYFDCDC